MAKDQDGDPQRSARRLGEFELIDKLLAPLTHNYPLAYNLSDDAAVLRPRAGYDLVLTKDAIVEGVHFRPDDPPVQIAQKLMRVNLSDLAAKGAAPIGFLLAFALDSSVDETWLTEFVGGIEVDSIAFAFQLLGGDTVSTPGPKTFSLTAIGEVPVGSTLLRSGAVPGDRLFVSGTIGDAWLGLRILNGALEMPEPHRSYLIERYRLPEPDIELGSVLRGIAHAAIDVSDGLIADLKHICEASDVGAELQADLVPLSDATLTALSEAPDLGAGWLAGGDDYRILFSAPPGKIDLVRRRLPHAQITEIGRVVEGGKIDVRDANGDIVDVSDGGFRHF